jgi:hypothetical protein
MAGVVAPFFVKLPWSETAYFIKPLDLSTHIIYTVTSNIIIYMPSKRLNGSAFRRAV